MKKFWLVTIISLLMLAGTCLVGVKKAYATMVPCHSSIFETPPYFVEDCTYYPTPPGTPTPPGVGYWEPYCAPFVQFDRCANESFYLKNQQRIGLLTSNARWIWQFGHDGSRGQSDILSANGVNGNDMSGFVNVIRNDLFGTQATYGYNYLRSGSCAEVPHPPPDGSSPDPNGFIWCEIDVAALIGASQIINNMLGMGGDNAAFNNLTQFRNYCPGSTPFSSDERLNGINVARCRFFEWWSLINYYASQPVNGPNGWINWDQSINYNNGDCRTDAVVYRDKTDYYDVSDPDALDTGSYVNCSEDHISRYIVFYNPDGLPAFRINKSCGNLTGPLRALQTNGQFNIDPIPASALDDAENPSSVDFTSSYLVDADLEYTDVSATVTRRYYIDKYNSPSSITLSPTTTETISGNELSLGSHGLLDVPVNNLRTIDPTLRVGDKICQRMTINPGTGTYNFSTRTLSGTSPVSETVCDTVQDRPYVKFFGGDVYAGGGFPGSGCGATSSIITYNNTNHTGSSTQFAATALGFVAGFTSANLGTAGDNQPPNGLTFANNPLDGVFGSTQCYNDYWSTSSGLPVTAGINYDVDTAIPSGSRKYGTGATNVTISGGIIDDDEQKVVYVDGNVYISGDIEYSDTFKTGLGLTNESEIPSFTLITTGNIYISNNVHNLNGIYIAQGTGGSGGTIYTCGRSSGPIFTPYLTPSGATNAVPFLPGGRCNSRLTVYGTFIAKTVKFLRTDNSLRDSTAGETYTNSRAAETFVMSPELYAGAGGLCSAVPGICSGGSYDSITSLAPVL